MMGGNVEATQGADRTAQAVSYINTHLVVLRQEAKKRQLARLRTGRESPSGPIGPNGKTKDLELTGRATEITATVFGIGHATVRRALHAKKEHKMKVPLTRTQKRFLLLLQKGYLLEVEKRGPGYISQFCGAEIGGQGMRFDAAQRMINESLVEKVSEDGCTVKYGISPTAVQLLDSCREAHR